MKRVARALITIVFSLVMLGFAAHEFFNLNNVGLSFLFFTIGMVIAYSNLED